ncbi:MAG: aminotransferase class I/II-fold pyridoxal phosphate-dependent enzyme [Treponema sp.]|jgi:histidinol-phosphate aminotransferase|nr:aminotransferase class I/II-fold pyridoxal phosphate-dependent enzyme [Treponema sp.]
MSKFWNSRTRELSPYIPGEQPQNRQYIKLNTNENPYPPSPAVIEAITRAANERLRLYPDPSCTALRDAVAERRRVKPEQVFAGNGSDEVIAFAFAAFFEGAYRAAPILFPSITYSFYPVYAHLWGIPYECPRVQEDFSINHTDYLKACGGVVFPNPNAPTGMLMRPEHVRAIAQYHAGQSRRHHAVVIVDEAYIDFAGYADAVQHAARQTSAVHYIEEYPNLLTVHTLSKSASLAGLRLGFAIGNEELIEGLCRVRDSFNSYPVDRLALAGGIAAMKDAAYYEAITRTVIATRERVSAALVEKGYAVLPSRANFLFVRHPAMSGSEFFTVLRNAGILVRHFNKERIADFLRVSIGTDAEMDAFLTVCGST